MYFFNSADIEESCRLLPPEKKKLFYFRSTLLSAAKRPSCQATSDVICAGSSGGFNLFQMNKSNSSTVTDVNEVSEVDEKKSSTKKQTEVEELGKEDLALKVMKEDPGTSNCLTNFYCLV